MKPPMKLRNGMECVVSHVYTINGMYVIIIVPLNTHFGTLKKNWGATVIGVIVDI